jgi:hypothetical protein
VTTMGLLAAGTTPPLPPTKQQIMDRLMVWREHLLELGQTNCVLTRAEVMRELDRWLDALSDLRGR